MLDNMKTRAITTKRAATGALTVAGTVVKRGLGAMKDKGYDAALKLPLVADEETAQDESLEQAEEADEEWMALVADGSLAATPSSSKVDARGVKEKLSKARSALKLGVDQVKSRCDVAVTGATGTLSTASSTLQAGMGAVKGKCDAKIGNMVDKLHGFQSQSVPLLGMLEAECIEALVSMGFARKDALKAVRVCGTEDFDSIVEFLCQKPGSRASAPDWDAHIAQCIARRMMELELDAEDDLQVALALSKFQAEASEAHGRQLPEASPFAPFHCWEVSDEAASCTHVTGMLCTRHDPKAIHLQPSVATWWMPLPNKPTSSITVQPDLIDLSVASAEQADVNDSQDLLNIDADNDEKITEATSLVSSHRGAVCCGA